MSEVKLEKNSLKVADAGVSDVRELPPLSTSFPSSQKIEEGELKVPARVITLGGGEPPLKVYDTTGPQGIDIRKGLPARRADWIERRLREAPQDGTRNVTQMHYARRGIITEEMRFVALRENV